MNIASFGTIETLQHFLKRHSIELTEKQITRIEKLVTDLDTYTTEENKNSKVIVYTYLAADIESLWKEYGVNVFTKPLSWSGRVIKRHADEITKKLDERWEKTFYELDKLVLSLQTDPTSDQLYMHRMKMF